VKSLLHATARMLVLWLKPHPDSAKTTVEDIRLTKEWKRYRIRLKKLDLSSIKTGFVVTLTGRRPDATIYLDSIRFVQK
jgi:hypothetical protein